MSKSMPIVKDSSAGSLFYIDVSVLAKHHVNTIADTMTIYNTIHPPYIYVCASILPEAEREHSYSIKSFDYWAELVFPSSPSFCYCYENLWQLQALLSEIWLYQMQCNPKVVHSKKICMAHVRK